MMGLDQATTSVPTSTKTIDEDEEMIGLDQATTSVPTSTKTIDEDEEMMDMDMDMESDSESEDKIEGTMLDSPAVASTTVTVVVEGQGQKNGGLKKEELEVPHTFARDEATTRVEGVDRVVKVKKENDVPCLPSNRFVYARDNTDKDMKLKRKRETKDDEDEDGVKLENDVHLTGIERRRRAIATLFNKPTLSSPFKTVDSKCPPALIIPSKSDPDSHSVLLQSQSSVSAIETHIGALQNTIRILLEEIKRLSGKLREKENEQEVALSEHRKALEDVKREMMEEQQCQQARLIEEQQCQQARLMEEHQCQQARLMEEANAEKREMKERIEELEKVLSELRVQLGTAQSELEERKKSLESVETKLSEQTKVLKACEKEKEELRKQVGDLRVELEAKSKLVKDTMCSLNVVQADLCTSREQVKDTMDSLNVVQADLCTSREQVKDTMCSLNVVQADLCTSREQHAIVVKEKEGVEERYKDLEKAKMKADEMVDERDNEIQSLNNRLIVQAEQAEKLIVERDKKWEKKWETAMKSLKEQCQGLMRERNEAIQKSGEFHTALSSTTAYHLSVEAKLRDDLKEQNKVIEGQRRELGELEGLRRWKEEVTRQLGIVGFSHHGQLGSSAIEQNQMVEWPGHLSRTVESEMDVMLRHP
ncbi:hypothetical protein K435DRAFT_471608 [Dendrothele bispora CBS 962.96]|uniref:Uncharacterized protein n=1 Tax=Dendrothele bispora (strain CBS 962.96) TaxID=1314807 RepID=A0A4S8KZW5_DENBC|nr:hypothetical protein K435DRAFT_471608 [Dendrothele bispora CBS 962.96]